MDTAKNWNYELIKTQDEVSIRMLSSDGFTPDIGTIGIAEFVRIVWTRDEAPYI